MKQIHKNTLMTTLALSAMMLSYSAEVSATEKSSFAGRLYLGANIGQSTLKPKAISDGTKINTETDTAFKLNLGYKIKPNLALDVFYTDLGAATLSTSNVSHAKVNYKLTGISGIYSKKITGNVKGFAKLGFAKVSNTVSKGISLKQLNDSNIFTGLGVEIGLGSRFSIKAEYEYFDKDIQLLSTGVNVNF